MSDSLTGFSVRGSCPEATVVLTLLFYAPSGPAAGFRGVRTPSLPRFVTATAGNVRNSQPHPHVQRVGSRRRPRPATWLIATAKRVAKLCLRLFKRVVARLV